MATIPAENARNGMRPSRRGMLPVPLFSLDVSGLYDLGPFVELPLQESTELLGRHVDRDRTESGQLLLHFRHLLDFCYGLVQFGDGSGRRVRRSEERIEKESLKSGQPALRDRRDVRQARHAFGGRYPQRSQLARLYMGHRRHDVVEREWDVAAYECYKSRTVTGVGNLQHLEPGHLLEELHVEVRAGAYAGCPVIQRAGLGLRDLDELGHRFPRKRRVRDEKAGYVAQHCNRSEVLDGVVRQVSKEPQTGGEDPAVGKKQ